ncbi:MAG: PD40 domain-containing protein [Phycisphaerales bacterium]|nr:PD40 domain-containing protein [Phycisphaerales bacterium]MCB9855011.1 PD40 domain-containing protein [Phycisphaerales bacterium]MCB9863472.1 PD40 domain-containing protein [Phycisphaerales bacterium]
MKHWRTILGISLALLVAGGGFVAWKVWPRKRVTVTDARKIRTPEANAQVRDILWDVPEPADEILRLTDGATDYALDTEGRRLVFVRGAGADADVYVRERVGETWGAAVALDAVNSPDGEFDLALSPDGNTLVFSSDRAGAVGGFDLFISRYSKGAWGSPAPINGANSAFDEIGATVSQHGTQVIFASNRPVDSGEAPGEQRSSTSTADVAADFNLYRADLLSEAPPVMIAAANSVWDELAAALSPAGDFLYFASNRRGGTGGFDLYRIRMLPDGYGAAELLDTTINTQRDELDPMLGLSGFQLTYRSSDGADDSRLLQSTSREVYRDVTFERGVVDWAALWRQIAPNLMWALLALILTLLFLAMMRDFRDRKIGLMARCLLASLLAHLVLMLLFNVLKVSTTIASAIGGQDRIRVSLLSEASAGEIGEQIRGEFVDVQTVAAEVANAERPALESQPVEAMTAVELAPRTSDLPSDAPSEASLTRIETTDADAASSASADVRMADALAELNSTFAESSFADVELPMPTAAETHTEAPTPAGVALVGETTLDSVAAPAQVATSQPAGAMSIDIGVFASVPTPSDAEALAQMIEANDSTPNGSTAVELPSTVTYSDAGAPMQLAALDEIALPGDVAAQSGRDELGVQVASIDVATPAQAALAMPTPKAGGELVELEIVGAASVSNADDVSEAIVRAAEDARGDIVPVAPAQDVPLDDDAIPGISLAIALPGGDGIEDKGLTPTGAISDESVDTAMPDVVWSASGLPSASEALAVSQRGSATLTTLGPESDTAWVTKDAMRASRESGADDADDTATTPTADIDDGADVPIVRIALGVGIPTAPPARPTGIRRGMIGRIVGTVEDAERGVGLSGARVLLALPDDDSIVAVTDDTGSFEIQVPPVPDHFALSASRAGYVPESLNIEAARVRGRTLTVNFALSRQSELVIALEADPDVHHLGNDKFQGRINSQFQRKTEGRTYRATFEVSRDQLPPNYSRAEVILMVKGVQCPHQVRINNRLINERLADAPRDGSFGEYRAAFDPGWLIEGRNQFKIRARSCSGDLDDFEFVNVQIRLRP